MFHTASSGSLDRSLKANSACESRAESGSKSGGWGSHAAHGPCARVGCRTLSEIKETEKSEDTGEKFKRANGLPDFLEVDLHIAIGWASIASIKSARPSLEELIIQK